MDGQPFGLVLVLLDCIVLLPGFFRFLDVTPERQEGNSWMAMEGIDIHRDEFVLQL